MRKLSLTYLELLLGIKFLQSPDDMFGLNERQLQGKREREESGNSNE